MAQRRRRSPAAIAEPKQEEAFVSPRCYPQLTVGKNVTTVETTLQEKKKPADGEGEEGGNNTTWKC